MMLRHRAPEVLTGSSLPEGLGTTVDRVLVLDHLCCTAVAMNGGQVTAMTIATSRAAALGRLTRRVAAPAAVRPRPMPSG